MQSNLNRFQFNKMHSTKLDRDTKRSSFEIDIKSLPQDILI